MSHKGKGNDEKRREKRLLDQKHIGIIVRTIMPELYRIQGFHNDYNDFMKRIPDSRPKVSCEKTVDGIRWIRTERPKKKTHHRLN